ncbi:hypothetical protein KC367_g128 [Hortaea werneckii]|nr:hypothetical protein KC367_g128 [Hortaea werneckii]
MAIADPSVSSLDLGESRKVYRMRYSTGGETISRSSDPFGASMTLCSSNQEKPTFLRTMREPTPSRSEDPFTWWGPLILFSAVPFDCSE